MRDPVIDGFIKVTYCPFKVLQSHIIGLAVVADIAIYRLKFSSSFNLVSQNATKLSPLLRIFQEAIYEIVVFPLRKKDVTTLRG
jgi:hypothetical protein